MRYYYRFVLFFVAVFLLNACATYKTQIKKGLVSSTFPDKEIQHTFYLIGDAGNSEIGTSSIALQSFKNEISKASKNSTVIFLGDNIYPKGMPNEDDKNRAFAEHQLNVQTSAVENFKGNTIFIPGNHDWYSGVKGLKRQEDYIEEILGAQTFLPENGCPIEKVDIDESTVLIVIDGEWYLTDWDKHPTINDDCEIRTRNKFFEEFEGLIKKSQGKTTLVAIHNPMFSNGPHAGQFDFKSNLKPLPILGSLKNLIRKTSGISPADTQNKNYNYLIKRIVTLAQENDKVIFVSGHEHNLQYLKKDNLPQIISGSGSKNTATRNVSAEFTSSDSGYAILDVFKDGASFVRFYSAKTNEIIFQTEVLASDKSNQLEPYKNDFPAIVKASIYTDEEVDKTNFHKGIWGKRYRKYYGEKVAAPTVNLDTLFGGVTPLRKGGGHQSKSLRLIDGEGKQYVMRALRKSAEVYLQAMAFKDQYIIGDFEDTFTESLLQDFYTGSHPYAPFTTGELSDAIDLYHTNPVLYYVPKQNALGAFNTDFGDELYMIEEHVGDSQQNLKSFGFAKKIESTDDLLKKLRKDEKYVVDDVTYLRARLFDMVIGDWDRHVDQWRWAEFKDKKSGKVVFKPIPRDRDQTFSIMGDGALMQIATRITPPLKLMEGFYDNIRNVKGFNSSPYSLDMIIINQTEKKQWIEQAEFIQKNLTAEVIERALHIMPKEIQDETVLEIKRILVSRIKNLNETAGEYYKIINKFAVIRGTDKDDWFDIERLPNGLTKVVGYRIKNGEKGTIFHERVYDKKDTKEIWIYGLDDDDVFKTFGEGNSLIKIRIIGGQNNDTYNVENGKRVKLYDYKSKKNEFITNKGSVKLTDDYETNVYDYTKLKNNINQFIPTVGFNPDDGVKIGASNTYTTYGFERNPFTSQHILSGSYFFATNGFEIGYHGEFSNVIGTWNLGLDAKMTSPNYSINFFDFGNETSNLNALDEDNFDMDFNRVKISSLAFKPSLVKIGTYGTRFKVGASYEAIEVEETSDRFINIFYTENQIENKIQYVGVNAEFSYENQDNKAFPTLGMKTRLEVGYKANIDESNGFSYITPSIGFDYKLVPSGQLVLATKIKGNVIFGDNFEFYQAASLGASDGLRGYRNQRFTGKSSFYQSTDLRLNLTKLKTVILPLHIGVYGGVDYGRVWLDGEDSDKWHNAYGGGVFANAADVMTFQISVFNADEGARFSFGLGFGF
ncbi:metallophosphoesterase [Aureibaculum sp. A20]|uniref:Metallophosphoesterase n=1 Tax=Aureibaculum flavum TaxID=2795986 RepID=A0ABS0WSB7_9FLAO|nr:metallophosphoesterase [Aureibaculum flavum]MBJ2174768.1 metallophosphoesterase [Aureibaculum flavum]